MDCLRPPPLRLNPIQAYLKGYLKKLFIRRLSVRGTKFIAAPDTGRDASRLLLFYHLSFVQFCIKNRNTFIIILRSLCVNIQNVIMFVKAVWTVFLVNKASFSYFYAITKRIRDAIYKIGDISIFINLNLC